MTQRFLTASELARRINRPTVAITRAVEAGQLIAAARAGGAKNSAILFAEADVPGIEAALAGKADAPAGGKHMCKTIGDIAEKAAALRRAFAEQSK